MIATFFWSALARAQTEVEWLGPLPAVIQESSGLLVFDDMLVTHNDSGNSPELFFLDSVSLEVRRRVRISNAINADWEDLAEDADYVYIGDFGNNLGNRKDLKILRVSKSEIATSDTLEAEIISFQYEDQTDFKGTQNSDWDAEALYAGRDSLWIFTKQWQSQGTVVYAVPKVPGSHIAVRKGALAVSGLITGACANADQSGILLSGYSPQLQPFLALLVQAESPGSLEQRPEKTQIAIAFAQAEGITADPGGRVFLSTEAFSNRLISLPAGVYKFSLDASRVDESLPTKPDHD